MSEIEKGIAVDKVCMVCNTKMTVTPPKGVKVPAQYVCLQCAQKAEEAQRLGLGATNSYPEGKLNKDDEGGVVFKVGTENGQVTINFGKPIVWIAFSPMQAIEIAKILITRANQSSGN